MSIKDPNIERLLAAFHHQKLDRVPNFEIVMDKRILTHVLGKKVNEGLWNISPADAVKAVVSVGQDAIPCPLHYNLPYGSVKSHEDMEKVIVPDPRLARKKLEEYLKAVSGTNVGVSVCMSGPLTPAYMSCGPVPIESFMYLIYDEPELIERVMDMYLKYYLELVEIIRDLPFHFFYIGDDISYTKGPMISPVLLEKYWVPRAERLVKAALSTGRPVLFHCCGDQSPALPYFIKWGVHAIHPLQPDANNIYDVYEKYGKQLTLVGNIDVGTLLSFGTPDEVRKDTKEHIDRLADDGGYVVCSSHSIIDSVVPENYLAMVETAHKYGIYK